MFNIFTLAFFAVFIGLGLAMFITRQKTPQPLQLVPPEDDSLIDPKDIRELTLEDLYVVGEKLCEEIKLEYESVPKLINIKMKRLIKNEALSNNMLKKKKSARLPI